MEEKIGYTGKKFRMLCQRCKKNKNHKQINQKLDLNKPWDIFKNNIIKYRCSCGQFNTSAIKKEIFPEKVVKTKGETYEHILDTREKKSEEIYKQTKKKEWENE